ncbi:MAG: response regulator [Anaerolineae bacterium]|nr:response regulator [Anaerolineae bacterium]
MTTPPNLNNKHIIVVEDNVDNYNLILRLLTGMGIEHCEWISSGWKVAEEADNYEQVDLILLDIQLPYEDGFAVHNRLRRHARLKDTSIVAVTANASETYMQRAINAGFDGFIGKPIDPDRFPDQVCRVLEGKAVWEWQ